MDYTLAIDQGTHASRAVVFDADGRSLGVHLAPVELVSPRPQRAQQHAGQLLASVRQVTDAALRALTADQRRRVRACGISTQRSTVLAWQGDGTPITPAINWQDTRGAAQVAGLQARADAIRRLSGLPLSPYYGASKLHWLQRACSREAAWYGPLASFLLHNLTGDAACRIDHGNAQRMQLMDIHSCDWSPVLLDCFQLSAGRLPACTAVMGDYGELAEHAIPVTACNGDQNAAWFGHGRPDNDTALVNLGSGGFVLAPQTDATDRGTGLMTSIAVSRRQQPCEFLAEGTVNGAGNALQWLQQRHAGSDIVASMADWLAQEPAPPVFINSVGGLGSPWWEHRLQPAFHPDTDAWSLAAQAVAVAESIVFLVQANLELLRPDGAPHRLRVSGGLSRLRALCQKLADLTGLPVMRAENPEASARGIAWLAAGQPDGWAVQARPRWFQPRTDRGLEARYRQFREQLQLRLDACAHE